jgi:hypothetical protein
MNLDGSNDVDDDNRGVIVKNPEFGKVKIGWDDFDKVTFVDKPEFQMSGYSDYPDPKFISGQVRTDRGNTLRGRIIYDLDEEWDFELLHGMHGETEYIIPFRIIKSIKPEGRRRAIVELRSGRTIELEESQDVTRKNDGILVFTDSRDPEYVRWQDVAEVVLDR